MLLFLMSFPKSKKRAGIPPQSVQAELAVSSQKTIGVNVRRLRI
jgi:hypothetical protein